MHTARKAALFEPFSVSSEKHRSPGNLPVNPDSPPGCPFFSIKIHDLSGFYISNQPARAEYRPHQRWHEYCKSAG